MSAADFRAALASPNFSHVSTRQWYGGMAFAYHHDATSPSGVKLAASLPLSEAQPILQETGTHAYRGPQRGDLAFADAQSAEAK